MAEASMTMIGALPVLLMAAAIALIPLLSGDPPQHPEWKKQG